jgi:hypothetical protein
MRWISRFGRGARHVLRGAVAIVLACASGACGYHFVNDQARRDGPFAVAAGEMLAPHATSLAALLDGARAELARAGALGASSDRVITIDLVRVDEVSEGVRAAPSATGAQPFARGVRVTVVARARLAGGATSSRDTGDMRASEIVASAPDPALGAAAFEAASRAASRRLGERLARRILGYPEPSEL